MEKKLVNRLFPLMISLLILVACSNEFDEPLEAGQPVALAKNARPMVIDTDMAADDWMAILYLLKRPDVDVRAITVTGAGEAHCDPGVHNALNLAALAGRPNIPVTCGRTTPLLGDHTFPVAWREDVDELSGLQLPENPGEPAVEPAVKLLSQAIQEASGELVIVALGPLTNLGQLLDARPELADQIANIVIMGGAVEVPGNVGPSSEVDNNEAEWNIYIDPHAAQLVLESGATISLIPLDATNHTPVTIDFVERIQEDRATSSTEFVYRLLSKKEDDVQAGYYYFWDPLAAVASTNPDVVSFVEMPLMVEEEEGPVSGDTRFSEDGTMVNVAINADRTRFEELFLQALNEGTP
jgi:pyrimidine-specific ribonucleoside hydrolase